MAIRFKMGRTSQRPLTETAGREFTSVVSADYAPSAFSGARFGSFNETSESHAHITSVTVTVTAYSTVVTQ